MGNHNPRVGGSSPSSATKKQALSDDGQKEFTQAVNFLGSDGAESVKYDHPLSTIPAHDDWGGWVETWCRDDTGNIDCVPYFMREAIADDVTPEGWLKLPCVPWNTPYKLARWVYSNGFPKVRAPWMGTGMTPSAVKAKWLQMIQDTMDSEKPKPPAKKLWVKSVPGEHLYFIESAFGPIKIGVSSDPESRLQGMQTGHPGKLRLLAVVRGGGHQERSLHTRFAEHRVSGEWFNPAPEILAEIARLNSEQAA